MQSLGPEQLLAAFFHKKFECLYELSSTGKSGSLFYFTEDKNYVIKEIPEVEFDKFNSILKTYYEHITRNKRTLGSQFYGLHQVTWSDSNGKKKVKYLVIMNNVFKYQDFSIGLRYDLKGSSQGRTELEDGQTLADHCAGKIKTSLKDNDWRQHVGELRFVREVTQEEAGIKDQHFNEIVKKDADFLEQCEIMDYSLLVGQILVLSDET